MKRILIIEDEKKIADIIKIYLDAEGFEADWTSSGIEGISRAVSGADLVVLDLMLPDMEGEEVCRIIRQTSDVPIIMLTAKSSEEERVRGLGLGADDYVVKPFSPRELMLRIKAVLKRADGGRDRNAANSANVVSFNGGLLRINEARREVTANGHQVELTPVEFKALLALSRNAGLALTRAQLIDLVYGYSFDGFDRTVDAHIKNIRHKIDADPRKPLFIQTVYGVGYRFIGHSDEN